MFMLPSFAKYSYTHTGRKFGGFAEISAKNQLS
jgi:hypothetical protein